MMESGEEASEMEREHRSGLMERGMRVSGKTESSWARVPLTFRLERATRVSG